MDHKTSPIPIPDGPADLTAQWLTAALRAGGAIAGPAVTAFSVEPPGGAPGLYGQTVRLRLVYDQETENAPRSLIAKFSSATPELRERAIGSYAKEIHFYQEVAARTGLPTPACYYADMDTATYQHVILLEDMAPASSGSRLEGCSPAQAALAVGHIAAFHAAWWESPALSTLTWLPDADFGLHPQRQWEEYDGWWSLFLARIDIPLPEPIHALGEQLGKHRARIERHLFTTPPRTLLHGDYHLGNLIFATPAGGIPFAVVDWQMLRRGRGVRDVAYFLSENLLPADRRVVEMSLLADYHRRLVEDGVCGYTFTACLDDYRLALLQRFRALVSTIAVMPFTAAERQMHVDVLLPRNVAAILDHDAGALLGQF